MEGFKFLFRPVLNGLYFTGLHAYPFAFGFCTAMLGTALLMYILAIPLAVERSIVVFFGLGTIFFILGVWRYKTVCAREEKLAELIEE